MKRAAICVRTSSERQAEKASPEEQEQGCRNLATERGYGVVKTYADTERYPASGKLVQPSGSRSDRPALLRMIQDAKAGAFDVIVARREDRRCRGFRPMLSVLELVEDNDIGIDLVTESFDEDIAPVKTWAAKQELKAIKERTQMGRIARVKEGKLLGGIVTLGYESKDDRPVIVESEAETVRFIFNQFVHGDGEYPDGVPVKVI